MELAHNLTLNEQVVKTLPDHKKDVFVFEWLQFLNKVLSALNRVSAILPNALTDLQSAAI